MNYELFVAIFISIFPIKLLSHDGGLNIRIESISTNRMTQLFLCNISSETASNFTQFSLKICLEETNHSLNVQNLLCRNLTVIVETRICDNILIRKFNDKIRMLSVISVKPKFNQKLLFEIKASKYQDKIFESGYLNFSTRSQKTDVLILKGMKLMYINATYTSKCKTNHYGPPACEKICIPMNTISGHYYCDLSGDRVCHSGWKGKFCSDAVCENCNNGQCVAPGKCRCDVGWTGNNCTVCQKAPGCKHGTCQYYVEHVNNSSKPKYKVMTCACLSGWGGQQCDIDLKYCITHHRLCRNGGVCHNYYGNSEIHYLCQCAPGFSGRHCQFKTGDCYERPCDAKDCSTNGSRIQCDCYSGFSGLYCQVNNALQNQIQSFESNLKSDISCINSRKGYLCKCSIIPLGVCECKFFSCPNGSPCVDKYRPKIYCQNDTDHILEYTTNFDIQNQSAFIDFSPPPLNTEYVSNDSFNFKIYFSILALIPILIGVLLLFTMKFRYKFRRKQRTCIKTIHNDLKLSNHQPIPEHNYLLNSKLLHKNSISNIYTIPDATFVQVKTKELDVEDRSGTIEKLSNTLTIDEEKLSNPVIFNPNLLINHYKNLAQKK